ncbi:MAG: hypothetical protein Q8O55_08805 [Dehalococcoidales bacterium]|nr:hypothetical protein [Dehalococcoidales bacterium]
MAVAKRKPTLKRFNLGGGGLKLHDARLVLGIPVIAHTGRVNSYARCLGGKLKGADGVADARRIMASSVTACGGVPGGKKRGK